MGITYSKNRDIIKFQAEGMRIFGIVFMSPICLIARDWMVDERFEFTNGTIFAIASFVFGFWLLAISYEIIFILEDVRHD